MQQKITYKPSTTANFGESGDAVRVLQTKLNTQNVGKAGYTPLKVDGLYGPLTQAAAQPSQLITTSTKARSGMVRNETDLNNALTMFNLPTNQTTQSSPTNKPISMEEGMNQYDDMLGRISSRSDPATKALISSIQASKMRQQNAVNKQYENYKGGLQLLGIQHNDAQSSPELLAGHIQEAETQHQDKLSEIESEMTKALLDAQEAKDSKDRQKLDDSISYWKQLKADQAEELKKYQDTILNSGKLAEAQIDPNTATAIYKQLKNLAPEDQQAFIEAMAKQFGLHPSAVVSSLSSIIKQKEKDDLDLKDKRSIIANRGGSGSGGKVTVQNASAEIKSHLKDLLGPDNYMAPEKWIQLRDDWLSNKLPVGTFDNLYKKYLNPLSYGKAGFAEKKETTAEKIARLKAEAAKK